MRTEPLSSIQAENEGELVVRADEPSLVFTAHWPFDTSTDEWIDLSVRVPATAVVETRPEVGEGFQLLGEDGSGCVKLEWLDDHVAKVLIRGANSLGRCEMTVSLTATQAHNLFAPLARV